MFAERLDLLMSLTGVRNNALAHAASLDASYISRLRHGYRSLPEGQTYVLPISCYLARQIRLPYQRQAICEALGLKTAWPDDEQRAGALIYAWLMGEDLTSAVSMVSCFLNELVLPKGPRIEGRPAASARQRSHPRYEQRELYYGIEGKAKPSFASSQMRQTPIPCWVP